MGDCTVTTGPIPMPSGSGLKRSHSTDDDDDREGLAMGDCTVTGSPIPEPSGSGLKRSHSTDDDDDRDDACSSPKLMCKILELPERLTDPGSETEYSYQEDSTDLCCRSSTHSSSSGDRTEYEIRSPEEGPNIFGDSSNTESSVNDFHLPLQKKPSEPQDLGQPELPDDAGNSASSESSDGLFDPEIPRRDYWTCLQCRNVNNRPAFRYCEKCYKVRRDMYQPRAKPRKRRKRKTSKAAAVKGNGDRNTAFTGVKLSSCSQTRDSGVGCSQGTLGSALPASDGTLSDSGADTEITGIKLASTRNLDGLDALRPPISRGVDDVDGVEAPVTRGADEVDGAWPANRAVDEVDCPRRPTSVEVDSKLRTLSQRSVDQVGSTLHTLSQRSVDEVDSTRHTLSQRSVDEVDSVSLGVNKRSVKTQTDLSYISKSDVPKDPVVDIQNCMMCYARELDGIFVHSTHAHLVCCYKCTVRVWKTTKRCPLCNCKIMNVLRLFKGC